LTREEKEICEKLDALIAMHDKNHSFVQLRLQNSLNFDPLETEILFKLQELVDRTVFSGTPAEKVIS